MKKFSSIFAILCIALAIVVMTCACTPAVEDESSAETSESVSESVQATENESEESSEEESSEVEVFDGYVITVLDENGNPLEGAEVQLCIKGGMCLIPDFTGADGIVKKSANEATYEVTVRLAGYVTAEYVSFPEGSKELTIVLVAIAEETSSESESETESETEAKA